MGAILAILGSVWTILAKVVAAIPYQVWLCLGLILLGGWMFHGGSCRSFMCSKPVKPPRPISDTYDVVSVPTGASIRVAYGLKGRREAVVALASIQAPSTGEAAEASRSALEASAGATVRIEWSRGLLRGTASDADPLTGQRRLEPEKVPEQTTAETTGQDGLEARPPDVGVVFGESGADLAFEQIKAGHAQCLPGASKEYLAAEKSAKRKGK